MVKYPWTLPQESRRNIKEWWVCHRVSGLCRSGVSQRDGCTTGMVHGGWFMVLTFIIGEFGGGVGAS